MQGEKMRIKRPMNEEFKAGDVVWNTYNGAQHTVRRVSATGRLAFGHPPYKSGSYHSPYIYTHSRAYAIQAALGITTGNIPYAEARLREAQEILDDLRALKARLELESDLV